MALITRLGSAWLLAFTLLPVACGRTNSDHADPAVSGGPGADAATGGRDATGGNAQSGGRDASGGNAQSGGRDPSGGNAQSGAAGVGGVSAECKPGRTPLRRLTSKEYDNTVRDILGDSSVLGVTFTPLDAWSVFSNDADAYGTRPIHVEGWLLASEALAENYRAAGQLALPCARDALECATGFITDLGKRLFRRPVTDEEVSSYLETFEAGTSDGGTFEEGLEWVLGRMLQSPHFLYRIELESSALPPGTVASLDDYSIATRLSYFLWGSTPDPALLAAADAGQLSTEDGLTAEVQRMMAAPAFSAVVSAFHAQWLDWERVLDIRKEATTTPAWGTLQALMVRESELFVKSVFDAGGTFRDLLTATHTFVNPDLAQFYGVAYSGKGSEFAEVELPHRAGIVTLPSILAGRGANPAEGSAVRRGNWMRERLLCFNVPPEPPGLIPPPPELPANATSRQRVEAHSSDPVCAGCHGLIDPLGLPLEHFDEFGRYRDMERGLPIDASGGLTFVPSKGNVSDPTLAPVEGAADLAEQLSALPEAKQCLVKQWFRFAAGRIDEPADACTLDSLFQRFEGSGQKLDDLVLGIATSDSFRRRVDIAP